MSTLLAHASPDQGTTGVLNQRPRPRWARLWYALFLVSFLLAGCSDAQSQARSPLSGPGLHRAIAGGSQGTLYAWWIPAGGRYSQPRVLLWDGTNVAVTDPSSTDQFFTPLKGGLRCAQVALAPDSHAFACSQTAASQSTIFIKSLDDLNKDPQTILRASAPFAWSPDSRRLAYLHSNLSGNQPTCSVLVQDADPSDDPLADSADILLDQIPFNTALGETASSCPVASLAWSPSGAELATTLAAPTGVNLEVLHLNQAGALATVEGVYLLPGIALQAADNLSTASLFWSPDGKVLAALAGYPQGIEDGLYLLPAGAKTPLTEPHVTDVGEGAALAFSPDSRWLAVGTVGQPAAGENAILQVYDLADLKAQTLGGMLVIGSTLSWSADGTTLPAASAAKQGIVLWSWP
jgi:WD40 repeat protein